VFDSHLGNIHETEGGAKLTNSIVFNTFGRHLGNIIETKGGAKLIVFIVVLHASR
jgi:hypothetical protein